MAIRDHAGQFWGGLFFAAGSAAMLGLIELARKPAPPKPKAQEPKT